MTRTELLKAEIKRLRLALDEIVNPLSYIEDRAKKDGCQLSSMAHQIANSAAHLQDIARKALNKA
jgi:hypothetical protein